MYKTIRIAFCLFLLHVYVLSLSLSLSLSLYLSLRQEFHPPWYNLTAPALMCKFSRQPLPNVCRDLWESTFTDSPWLPAAGARTLQHLATLVLRGVPVSQCLALAVVHKHEDIEHTVQ